MRYSIILSILLLAGCGQKGALFLPNEQAQKPEAALSTSDSP